jgi:hypothetical protein
VLTFNIGTRPTLTATFRNIDGDLDDPTAILFSLLPPQGAIVTGTEANATNPSIGVWEWQLPDPLTLPGTYTVQAMATSGMQVADEICFKVPKSSFPPPV